MVKVADLIAEKFDLEVIATTLDTPLRDAAKVMAERKIGVLVCRCGEGGVEGVISERDIVRATAERPEAMAELTVGDLASREVVFCKPGDNVQDVASKMRKNGFRHMPVCAGKMLAGVVSVTDIFRYYINNCPDEATMILGAYSLDD